VVEVRALDGVKNLEVVRRVCKERVLVMRGKLQGLFWLVCGGTVCWYVTLEAIQIRLQHSLIFRLL
jgi:hypothetical protein